MSFRIRISDGGSGAAWRGLLAGTAVLAAVMTAAPSVAQVRFAAERERMAAEIVAMARETGSETGRPAFSDRVMAAMRTVPRHRFVPQSLAVSAYENRPLAIGDGQTISQPYIVALMTELLDPKPGDVVLEVGTGSGYQAAVLAEIVADVYTIEIVESLGRKAAAILSELGYTNVITRIGDGYNGWKEQAPFDGILVTAAPVEVPQPLIDQLKPGARLVIPVGGRFDVQDLLVIEKKADGSTLTRHTIPVRFVPLTRERR
ncbi:MAG: protein-L-isoaspartate O-methyltransferase [Betaproteobacteria bacterium RIFCSPLOWO2_02_FULL_63_19]|nr:MAG: protein-L-isoaspartate O-methyltransferase [Betaproteobacteria bacterium RIFCSPLOWO2_02_FULL_63_19]